MTLIYILLALIALGFLVFIHELGHFFAARAVGMKVDTFSIGFGKPLVEWVRKDVKWQVGWLPFGGFVKISGMDVSKKDQTENVDLYSIPGGFFSKSPLARIFVALAGPVANILFAFLALVLLWAMGGREKSFSEFTQLVGWVDPKSELFQKGLKPGDIITHYNGRPYTESRELLLATLLGDKKITLDGIHINYEKEEHQKFHYIIEPYDDKKGSEIKTTGIFPASYLIYNKFNGIPNELISTSPMIASGIKYGDRLVWADGHLLFSENELGSILNDERAFLLVKRGDRTFFSRQKRIIAGDLVIPPQIRHELIDWSYEAGIRKRWQQLYVLPYNLTSEAVVEEPLQFINTSGQKEVFSESPLSSDLEAHLEKGDRIIAVDGVPITTAYQLLDLIQTRHVHLIASRDVPVKTQIQWKDGDKEFFCTMNVKLINELAKSIGTKNESREAGKYVLLHPVEPKRLAEITTDNRYRLGINLQDQRVVYNPGPFELFNKILIETWQTLKGLFGGLKLKMMSGPVGIVHVIQLSWQLGIGEALFWTALISLNLAILNLLPLPVLDGGHISLAIWEMITGRKIQAKTMEKIIIPFVVLLVAFIIYVTFYDILRLFK